MLLCFDGLDQAFPRGPMCLDGTSHRAAASADSPGVYAMGTCEIDHVLEPRTPPGHGYESMLQPRTRKTQYPKIRKLQNRVSMRNPRLICTLLFLQLCHGHGVLAHLIVGHESVRGDSRMAICFFDRTRILACGPHTVIVFFWPVAAFRIGCGQPHLQHNWWSKSRK